MYQPLDVDGGEGKVLVGVQSEKKSGYPDSKWKLKFAQVSGSTLTDCAPMEPVSCAKDIDRTDGFTPLGASWNFECPRDHVVTHVKSTYSQVKLDREYQFKCCKVSEAS